jgi:Alpha-tubulin suppressor and related RCC1 domain-containing proteins
MQGCSFTAAGALVLVLLGCGGETTAPIEPSATTPLLTAAEASAVSFWQVGGGNENTCGVSTSYVAYCWGHNYYGSLGIGALDSDVLRTAPVAILGGLHFRQVSGSWGTHLRGDHR